MIQDSVFIVTFALMLIVLGAFVYVAFNSSNVVSEYADIQAKAYSIRKIFFWVLLIAGLFILFLTTRTLPYAAIRGNTAAATHIDVLGKQWFWELSQNTARAGEKVIFNVTSGDVNHGLGIYDSELRLLGQTQAMPGYENKLAFTFDKPGEYQLMCMEYCGLAHHKMISTFNVKSE